MSRVTDKTLIELLNRVTKGDWRIASDENYKFHIYVNDSSPIRYVLNKVPDDASNYDLRLMALAKQLAEEVLEYRVKQRRLSAT